jgi:tetratricopeptide (TPR) repeat protein
LIGLISTGQYDGLDLKVFEALTYTNRYRISYTNAIHGDFEDFAMACAILPNQTPAFALKERSAATAKKNYETTCELTLHFFNTSLKNDNASPQDFSNLIDARKTDGIISEYEHRKNAKTFDGEDLAHLIVYYGISEAERLFNEVKNDKEYEQAVTAEDLLAMAKAARMGGRRLEKSNDILLFLEKHFPYDASVQIELARNYIELKKHSEAKQHLQRVLNDDPKNDIALELMQGLKSL